MNESERNFEVQQIWECRYPDFDVVETWSCRYEVEAVNEEEAVATLKQMGKDEHGRPREDSRSIAMDEIGMPWNKIADGDGSCHDEDGEFQWGFHSETSLPRDAEGVWTFAGQYDPLEI